MRVPVQVDALLDGAEASLRAKAEATAAWMLLYVLRTVVVYATNQAEAVAFESLLTDAIETELKDAKIWSKLVHANRSPEANRAALDDFVRSTPTGRLDEPWVDHEGVECDAHFCVLLFGGKPCQDVHFPALQAAVLLDPLGAACAPVNLVDRVGSDASQPGRFFKTLGHVLTFSTDEHACALWARAVLEHNDVDKQVFFHCMPRTIEEYAATWTTTGSGVQARVRAASEEFREEIREQFKLVAWAENVTYRGEVIEAFVSAFPMSAPSRGGDASFSVRAWGDTFAFDGRAVYEELRRKWFVEGLHFSTTEWEKEQLRSALGATYWTDPTPASPEEQMTAQIDTFLCLFPDALPDRSDPTTMIYECEGVAYGPISAWMWLDRVRRNWRAEAGDRRRHGDMITTATQKAALRRHPWWKDPASKRRRDAGPAPPPRRGAPTAPPSCGIVNSDCED